MNISDEAVEAAAKAIGEATEAWVYPLWGEGAEAVARAALEAAARFLMAEVERELIDAKRMVALLVLKSGGKVRITRQEMAAIDASMTLGFSENPVTGEFVVTAGARE